MATQLETVAIAIVVLMATTLLFYQLELLPRVNLSWKDDVTPPVTVTSGHLPAVGGGAETGKPAREATGVGREEGSSTALSPGEAHGRPRQVKASPTPSRKSRHAERYAEELYSFAECTAPSSPLVLRVTPPESLHQCYREKVLLESVAGEDLRAYSCSLAFVELECDVTSDNVERDKEKEELRGLSVIRKRMPAFHTVNNNMEVRAEFFPDAAMEFCVVKVVTEFDDVTFDGPTDFSFEVQEFEFNGHWCWQCRPMLHLQIPRANEFSLWADGQWVWEWGEGLSLERGESKSILVRPMPWTLEIVEETTLADLQFSGRLKNEKVIQAVPVSLEWDREEGGYSFVLEVLDSGTYELEITLNAVYGGSEYLSGQPTPICTSSHIRHEWSDCDLERSMVHGSGVTVVVTDRADSDCLFVNPSAAHCTNVTSPGRWVSLNLSQPCKPPYCTGDRFFTMVNTMSWQGATLPYVWVPYGCYFHFYTEEDFTYCAAKRNYSWIHVMGDSLPREFVAYLMSIFGVPDTQKFETADQVLGNTGVRVSFQSWQDILSHGNRHLTGPENYRSETFLKGMLDHYNLLAEGTSARLFDEEINLDLGQMTGSPDVFIMNPAMAYALFEQTEDSYIDFLDIFLPLTKDMCTVGVSGRPPVRCIWYGNPFIVSAAHDGTDFLTQSRNEWFRDLTEPRVEAFGYSFYDPIPLTRSRPEESWDGLHYLRGYMEWNGHVASNNMQVLLNLLFGDCKGPHS